MAVLTVAVLKHTGHAPSLVAAAGGGDDVPNDGRTFFHVKNGSGSPINVTITSKRKCSQNGQHDVVVSVPATTGERMIGPFPKDEFDDVNGRFNVTYSAVTSLTVQAVSLAESGR